MVFHFGHAYVRLLQEEPVIEETIHTERSAYGYFLRMSCMTLYENRFDLLALIKSSLAS